MYRTEAMKKIPDAKAPVEGEPTGPVDAASAQSAGWDPFEVWRERIQRPRELSGKTAVSELDRARQKS